MIPLCAAGRDAMRRELDNLHQAFNQCKNEHNAVVTGGTRVGIYLPSAEECCGSGPAFFQSVGYGEKSYPYSKAKNKILNSISGQISITFSVGTRVFGRSDN